MEDLRYPTGRLIDRETWHGPHHVAHITSLRQRERWQRR
jgi:hypothetical protein